MMEHRSINSMLTWEYKYNPEYSQDIKYQVNLCTEKHSIFVEFSKDFLKYLR